MEFGISVTRLKNLLWDKDENSGELDVQSSHYTSKSSFKPSFREDPYVIRMLRYFLTKLP